VSARHLSAFVLIAAIVAFCRAAGAKATTIVFDSAAWWEAATRKLKRSHACRNAKSPEKSGLLE
jgi:hypothetical protein